MKTKARSKRVHLILNGKVAGNDALRAAVARQRAAGHRIEVLVTSEMGDARRFASEAGKVDLLIAAGGDGTLNEVLHGLMDLSEATRPILGIVPLGTANDFATGCGIPRDPAKALALCMKGEAVPIDVGKANDHWFINAASAGFGAEITATTSPELKRLLGPAAYTMMGAILAINIHQYHGMLRLPGREITGSGPVAIVGNGRQTGRRYPSRSPCIHRRRFARCACRLSNLPDRSARRGARIATASTRWRVYLLLANALAGGSS